MDWRDRRNHKREADAQAAEVERARAAAPRTWELYEELLTITPPDGLQREYDTVLFALTHAAWGGYKVSEADEARVRVLIDSLRGEQAVSARAVRDAYENDPLYCSGCGRDTANPCGCMDDDS